MRKLFEYFGYAVSWNVNTAAANLDKKEFKFGINRSVFLLNRRNKDEFIYGLKRFTDFNTIRDIKICC